MAISTRAKHLFGTQLHGQYIGMHAFVGPLDCKNVLSLLRKCQPHVRSMHQERISRSTHPPSYTTQVEHEHQKNTPPGSESRNYPDVHKTEKRAQSRPFRRNNKDGTTAGTGCLMRARLFCRRSHAIAPEPWSETTYGQRSRARAKSEGPKKQPSPQVQALVHAEPLLKLEK